MTTVGEARIEISADGAGEARSALEGVGSALSAVGAVAATVAAAGLAAVGAGLSFAIGEAMDSQVAMAGLGAVLDSTGGAIGLTAEQLQDMATGLQNTTRFSDEAAIAAETMLLRFENIGANVFPQALSASADLAAAMGTDLTAAAQAVGKALDNPAEGIGRLNTQLKLFTKAEMDAIVAMAEAGDLAGAQAAIMDRLGEKVGGTAEAMGSTFAGKVDILKNKFSDMGETIGGLLLPTLTTLADVFGGFIDDVTAGVNPLDALTKALANVLPDNLYTDFINAKIAVEDFLNTDFKSFTDDFSAAFAPSQTLAANNMGNALSNIASILNTDGPTATANADSLGTALGRLGGVTLNNVTGSLESLSLLLKGDLVGAIENQVQTIIDSFNLMGANISIAPDLSAWNGVFDQIGIIATGVANNVTTTWNGLGEQIGIIGQGVITKAGETLTKAVDKAKEEAGKALSVGTALINGITQGIIDGVGGAIASIKAAVSDIIQAAWDAAQAHSPSVIMAELGGIGLMGGLTQGINKFAGMPGMALATATENAIKAARAQVKAIIAPKVHQIEVGQNSYNSSNNFYGPINQQFGGNQSPETWLQEMADLAATA